MLKSRLPYLVLALALAGCASQPFPDAYDPPGFIGGFWNGFTIFFSLVSELFTHNRIYAFPNSGWPYDLGFFLGFGTWPTFIRWLTKILTSR